MFLTMVNNTVEDLIRDRSFSHFKLAGPIGELLVKSVSVGLDLQIIINYDPEGGVQIESGIQIAGLSGLGNIFNYVLLKKNGRPYFHDYPECDLSCDIGLFSSSGEYISDAAGFKNRAYENESMHARLLEHVKGVENELQRVCRNKDDLINIINNAVGAPPVVKIHEDFVVISSWRASLYQWVFIDDYSITDFKKEFDSQDAEGVIRYCLEFKSWLQEMIDIHGKKELILLCGGPFSTVSQLKKVAKMIEQN